SLAEVAAGRIAVPGRETTAFLLLRLAAPALGDVVELRYDRILAAVVASEVDAGLIIHESRFTYREHGLVAVADLGEWWEGEAGARAGVPAEKIEDVWFGAANQAGEDNRNVARMASLLAGLPEAVAGVTVNRLCASGLAAVVGACHAVIAGDGDLFVAGGVESMSRAPLVTAKPEKGFPRGDRTMYDTTLGWRFPNSRMAELF